MRKYGKVQEKIEMEREDLRERERETETVDSPIMIEVCTVQALYMNSDHYCVTGFVTES